MDWHVFPSKESKSKNIPGIGETIFHVILKVLDRKGRLWGYVMCILLDVMVNAN